MNCQLTWWQVLRIWMPQGSTLSLSGSVMACHGLVGAAYAVTLPACCANHSGHWAQWLLHVPSTIFMCWSVSFKKNKREKFILFYLKGWHMLLHSIFQSQEFYFSSVVHLCDHDWWVINEQLSLIGETGKMKSKNLCHSKLFVDIA